MVRFFYNAFFIWIRPSYICRGRKRLEIIPVIFILIIWLLESLGFSNRQANKIITYEKIDLIKPDRRDDLLADLRARTGLDIVKVQIGSINFLKDTAFIKVTYIPDDPEPNDIDMVTKFKKK